MGSARARATSIDVTRISFPVPTTNLAELQDRIERAITPQTKVIHFCHITNLTGQLFPVRNIARMARSRGIKTIVDGAHAFAHFPFKLSDLECDFYGTSLHKWLLAPVGHRIPVRPAREHRTAVAADAAAGGEDEGHPQVRRGRHASGRVRTTRSPKRSCFTRRSAIERKSARLRYLTDRWANRLEKHPRVKILSSREPNQAWGLANISLDGINASKAYEFLWSKYRIITAAINHAEYNGLRVTPNVYTTLGEIDTFAGAIESLLKLPSNATA